MDKNHVIKQLNFVSSKLKDSNVKELLTNIATRYKDLKSIELEDQLTISGILGSYLHQAYCDGRRLETPLENGLVNEPRIKELSDDLDKMFVKDVLLGKIPESDVLFVKEGKVFMDIANTSFENLSPYWQYDNFMAGACAARSVITNWDGITHENSQVRQYVTVAVANSIHEAWIARGNVAEWNEDLETAYINLSEEEKAKDLVHYQMATQMMEALEHEMSTGQSWFLDELNMDDNPDDDCLPG